MMRSIVVLNPASSLVHAASPMIWMPLSPPDVDAPRPVAERAHGLVAGGQLGHDTGIDNSSVPAQPVNISPSNAGLTPVWSHDILSCVSQVGWRQLQVA